jgi:iron complex outermembrane receptor protein
VVWSNRVSGFSAKPVTRDNSVEIPGAAQWDSWVSWRTRVNGRPMVIRAGIDNVLDRRYWRDAPTQSWGGVYLFAAPPRTYRLSAQFSF